MKLAHLQEAKYRQHRHSWKSIKDLYFVQGEARNEPITLYPRDGFEIKATLDGEQQKIVVIYEWPDRLIINSSGYGAFDFNDTAEDIEVHETRRIV